MLRYLTGALALRRGAGAVASSSRSALLALSLAAMAALTPSLGFACCEGIDGFFDEKELPDSARVQFRGATGPTIYPTSLILLGPQRALIADLPERAALYEEDVLPLRKLGAVGDAFQGRPLLDRIGRGSALGPLYRSGDALVAVFESEGAFRDALWRLRNPVGVVTRLSRSRGLASMRLRLDFRPLPRSRAPRGRLDGPIGATHGAGANLIITPPRKSLPRNNIF